MGRPPVEIERNRQFNVGLTPPEHDLLLARAARAGMRPVDYGRAKLLGAADCGIHAHDAPAPHLDPLLLVTLSRLGNNLNQIARRLNTLDLPAPPSLEPLLQMIRSLITRAAARDRSHPTRWQVLQMAWPVSDPRRRQGADRRPCRLDGNTQSCPPACQLGDRRNVLD